MRHTLSLFVIVIGMTMIGCGTYVEVPPAHVGKLSTASGLQENIIHPSRFRLSNMCYNCDDLILIEASDYPAKETMQIYMPSDQLNISLDIRGIFSVSADDKNIDMIFSRMSPSDTKNSRIRIISMSRIYETYAQPIIRETVRSVITQYSIEQIMGNREDISIQLMKSIRDQLAATPITAIQFGMADVQPPPVIVKAREAAKEREIAIQRAEADKQVALKEAEAALEVAVKQQEVDLKEAETQVLVNQKLSEGVNEAFITQRWLRVMDTLAHNTEGRIIILPYEAIKNPALLTGVFMKSMEEK